MTRCSPATLPVSPASSRPRPTCRWDRPKGLHEAVADEELGELPQRSMRAVPVVMLDVGPHNALKVAAVEDQQPVEALPRLTLLAQRSACAFAPRAHAGARMTCVPSKRKTSSKAALNGQARAARSHADLDQSESSVTGYHSMGTYDRSFARRRTSQMHRVGGYDPDPLNNAYTSQGVNLGALAP